MKPNMKSKIIVAALFLSTGSLWEAAAQDQKSSKKTKLNYSKHAHWVQMMHERNGNYFETVKAFEEFWKKRPEPSEEEERGHEKEEKNKRSLIGRLFHSEEKEREESNQYAIEYKRFKSWRREVLPYVQPDGRILTQEELLEIWKTQRQ